MRRIGRRCKETQNCQLSYGSCPNFRVCWSVSAASHPSPSVETRRIKHLETLCCVCLRSCHLLAPGSVLPLDQRLQPVTTIARVVSQSMSSSSVSFIYLRHCGFPSAISLFSLRNSDDLLQSSSSLHDTYCPINAFVRSRFARIEGLSRNHEAVRDHKQVKVGFEFNPRPIANFAHHLGHSVLPSQHSQTVFMSWPRHARMRPIYDNIFQANTDAGCTA